MTTAFVLSGGGSLGAVQVGMLQALAERRVTPDLLVGTSAGALTAVFVAAHGMSPTSLDLLAATWAALRRDDVFPLRAPQMMLALAGARDAVRPALGPGGGRRGGRHAGGRDRRRPALRDRVSKAASWPCPGSVPGTGGVGSGWSLTRPPPRCCLDGECPSERPGRRAFLEPREAASPNVVPRPTSSRSPPDNRGGVARRRGRQGPRPSLGPCVPSRSPASAVPRSWTSSSCPSRRPARARRSTTSPPPAWTTPTRTTASRERHGTGRPGHTARRWTWAIASSRNPPMRSAASSRGRSSPRRADSCRRRSGRPSRAADHGADHLLLGPEPAVACAAAATGHRDRMALLGEGAGDHQPDTAVAAGQQHRSADVPLPWARPLSRPTLVGGGQSHLTAGLVTGRGATSS
jgi:hypothetical protein